MASRSHGAVFILKTSKYKKRMSKISPKANYFTHSPLSSAVWTGLEPATPCVTGRYSNQLNYHTVFKDLFALACLSFRLTSLPFAFAKVIQVSELCKYFCNFFAKKCIFLVFVDISANYWAFAPSKIEIKQPFLPLSSDFICQLRCCLWFCRGAIFVRR